MLNILRSNDRGGASYGWLDTRHSFSFGEYHDPARMGFRALRVINEDRIAPGTGFERHPHRDMEILTYVLEGALSHQDSLGNGSTILPGDVQRMSAGTGVLHSERNASSTSTHLLQIWLIPDRLGHPPSYEQKTFAAADKRGRLCLVASPDGQAGSVAVHQDVRLYAGLLDGDERAELALAPGRHAWLQIARGSIELDGQRLDAGDGAALSDIRRIALERGRDAEVLLFDLG